MTQAHEYAKQQINELEKMGINAQNKNGATPLMFAVWISDEKTVKRLLEQGADVNIEDNAGSNVLDYAIRQYNLEILRLLIKSGMELNYKYGYYQRTAIFTPAEAGKSEVLRILLESGANPDVVDKYKMTALQWAAQQGMVESVSTLLAFNANVNTKNHKGITPLMSASISGVKESVSLLVSAGAEINAASKDGFTALVLGAYYGHVEIVKYLLAQGADKNMATKKGETALSIAEKKKYDDIVEILTD